MSARAVRRVVTVLALAAPAASAQSADEIARRVAAVNDGSVQMNFGARPGTCGDGRDVIRANSVMTVYPSIVSRGGWSDAVCEIGAMRVVIGIRERQITSVRTHVGNRRAVAPAAPLTDLGVVPVASAVKYLISVSSKVDGRPGRDALLPVALADSVEVWRDLIAIARDSSRPRDTRKTAILYVGMTEASAGAVSALDGIARDVDAERSLRENALIALADLPDGAGAPSIIRLARGSSETWLRRKATFWLGNTEDGRARAALRELAGGDTVSEDIRGEAIFALGHLRQTSDDTRYLQDLFPRLTSRKLRDKVIQSMGQTDDESGKRWLLTVVRDADQPTEMRKQALFWAGQNQHLPASELNAIYPAMTEPALKEHFIFVLSQRREGASVEKLIDIAKNDPDRSMRKKAMFWLGQSDDPRVLKFLQEAIAK